MVFNPSELEPDPFSYEESVVIRVSMVNGVIIDVKKGTFQEKVVTTEKGKLELFTCITQVDRRVVGKSADIVTLWTDLSTTE